MQPIPNQQVRGGPLSELRSAFPEAIITLHQTPEWLPNKTNSSRYLGPGE